MTNLEIAREYIAAIERGATGDTFARFFTPDVTFQEMPNRVTPHGLTVDLSKALRGVKRSQQIFKRQIYKIINTLAEGNRVALEIEWIGITAVQIQNLPPGSEIRDHLAVFLEFREGRIARQHDYDCFEPW